VVRIHVRELFDLRERSSRPAEVSSAGPHPQVLGPQPQNEPTRTRSSRPNQVNWLGLHAVTRRFGAPAPKRNVVGAALSARASGAPLPPQQSGSVGRCRPFGALRQNEIRERVVLGRSAKFDCAATHSAATDSELLDGPADEAASGIRKGAPFSAPLPSGATGASARGARSSGPILPLVFLGMLLCRVARAEPSAQVGVDPMATERATRMAGNRSRAGADATWRRIRSTVSVR
jgi:hypothetical protein